MDFFRLSLLLHCIGKKSHNVVHHNNSTRFLSFFLFADQNSEAHNVCSRINVAHLKKTKNKQDDRMNTIVSSFHEMKKTEWRTKGADCRKKVCIRINNLFVHSLLIKTWCCSVFWPNVRFVQSARYQWDEPGTAQREKIHWTMQKINVSFFPATV